jgi:hypothetical protein
MRSTYWLEKVLKMISLYVNALLCTLQYIVIHVMVYERAGRFFVRHPVQAEMMLNHRVKIFVICSILC